MLRSHLRRKYLFEKDKLSTIKVNLYHFVVAKYSSDDNQLKSAYTAILDALHVNNDDALRAETKPLEMLAYLAQQQAQPADKTVASLVLVYHALNKVILLKEKYDAVNKRVRLNHVSLKKLNGIMADINDQLVILDRELKEKYVSKEICANEPIINAYVANETIRLVQHYQSAQDYVDALRGNDFSKFLEFKDYICEKYYLDPKNTTEMGAAAHRELMETNFDDADSLKLADLTASLENFNAYEPETNEFTNHVEFIESLRFPAKSIPAEQHMNGTTEDYLNAIADNDFLTFYKLLQNYFSNPNKIETDEMLLRQVINDDGLDDLIQRLKKHFALIKINCPDDEYLDKVKLVLFNLQLMKLGVLKTNSLLDFDFKNSTAQDYVNALRNHDFIVILNMPNFISNKYKSIQHAMGAGDVVPLLLHEFSKTDINVDDIKELNKFQEYLQEQKEILQIGGDDVRYVYPATTLQCFVPFVIAARIIGKNIYQNDINITNENSYNEFIENSSVAAEMEKDPKSSLNEKVKEIRDQISPVVNAETTEEQVSDDHEDNNDEIHASNHEPVVDAQTQDDQDIVKHLQFLGSYFGTTSSKFLSYLLTKVKIETIDENYIKNIVPEKERIAFMDRYSEFLIIHRQDINKSQLHIYHPVFEEMKSDKDRDDAKNIVNKKLDAATIASIKAHIENTDWNVTIGGRKIGNHKVIPTNMAKIYEICLNIDDHGGSVEAYKEIIKIGAAASYSLSPVSFFFRSDKAQYFYSQFKAATQNMTMRQQIQSFFSR